MIACRHALVTGLVSGALWAVLFTGFTSGPAVRAHAHAEGIDLVPSEPSAWQLARRALAALVAGSAFGVGISLVSGRVARSLAPRDGVDPDWLHPGEHLVRHGPANHFPRSWWAVGGWLFLTATRLHFRPHGLLQRARPVSWPLEEIASVEATRVLGLTPNGVRVRFADGTAVTFAVALSERSGWVTDLTPA